MASGRRRERMALLLYRLAALDTLEHPLLAIIVAVIVGTVALCERERPPTLREAADIHLRRTQATIVRADESTLTRPRARLCPLPQADERDDLEAIRPLTIPLP